LSDVLEKERSQTLHTTCIIQIVKEVTVVSFLCMQGGTRQAVVFVEIYIVQVIKT